MDGDQRHCSEQHADRHNRRHAAGMRGVIHRVPEHPLVDAEAPAAQKLGKPGHADDRGQERQQCRVPAPHLQTHKRRAKRKKAQDRIAVEIRQSVADLHERRTSLHPAQERGQADEQKDASSD
jgi:hypothetical protein